MNGEGRREDLLEASSTTCFILDYGPHFMSMDDRDGWALWREVLGTERVSFAGRTGMYWRGRLFNDPPSASTLFQVVGPREGIRIARSVAKARLSPTRLATALRRSLPSAIW